MIVLLLNPVLYAEVGDYRKYQLVASNGEAISLTGSMGRPSPSR